MRYFTYKKWLNHKKFIQDYKKIIERYRRNPSLVAKELLGIKLHWWQNFYMDCICSNSRKQIYVPRNHYANNYKVIMKIIDEIKIKGENHEL